jgi:hypothetical protein
MGTRTRTARSVAAGLQVWAQGHDAHVRAAVGLLINHDVWLRRVEFQALCLHRDPDGSYWIDWSAARAAYDGGLFARASTSERAVLDLAIALASDRFRLSVMSTGKARLVAEAVAAAAGIPVPRRARPGPAETPHDHHPAPAGESEMTS